MNKTEAKIKEKIKYWEEQKEGYHESNIKYTNICMFIDDLKELSVNLVSKDKLIKWAKKSVLELDGYEYIDIDWLERYLRVNK